MTEQEFQKIVLEKFSSLDDKISIIDGKVSNLENKVSIIDEKISNLENKVSDLDSKVSTIDGKVSNLENKVSIMEIQTKENTQILHALLHLAEVNKAEHDKMMNDIAYVKGDVAALRRDITNVEIITSSNWGEIARLKAVK